MSKYTASEMPLSGRAKQGHWLHQRRFRDESLGEHKILVHGEHRIVIGICGEDEDTSQHKPSVEFSWTWPSNAHR